MNKALIKTKAAEANEHWHNMALNVMERSWMIGKALAAIKGELSDGVKWQEWCEENLSFGYSHASRFLAIGALPKKPELPKLASNAKSMPLLSIENLALVAGRVKKGISQDLAIREALFPPPPARTIMASDDEPRVPASTVVVPELKTKAKAKEYLTRPLALDIIGIVSDKEDVDVFVNRTTLEVIFEGLAVKWKGDEKKMRALNGAKLVLL